MIKIENQIVLQFNLGQFSDFISIRDFRGMEIIEHAGGLRPILNIRFLVSNVNILPYLNQGNLIYLRYGINELSNDTMVFEIQGDIKTQQYKLGSEVSLLASFYNQAFSNQAQAHFYEGKSFEVLQQICDEVGLKFKTNVNRTNDQQRWYPQGKKRWPFTRHIVERAFKDDSTFFIHAFDCNNFYFYDVNSLLQQGPRWILSCKECTNSTNSNIVNISNYIPDDSVQGQMSLLAGKNVKTVGYNLDTGEFSYPQHKLKTFTTLGTNNLNINSSNCQNYNFMITSGCEHSNTIKALNQNKRNNILFSSYAVRLSVPGQYRDFRLLDVVQLIPAEKDNEAEGFYIITGIVRQFADNMYRTNLVLNRESANGIKGNLQQGEK